MSAIKAGDLVMVVRPMPCCGAMRKVGSVHRVLSIDRDGSRCIFCGHRLRGNLTAVVDGLIFSVSRLIRIDPPALTEDTTTERELTT